MRYYPSMDWLPRFQPNNSLISTLRYFDRFDYPLTLDEIWFWQPYTFYHKNLFMSWQSSYQGYFFLKHRSTLVGLRQSRLKISKNKLLLASSISRMLSIIPSIKAIFITGALAMNNSPKNDDIDIMLIVDPYTLWLTRAIVVLLLSAKGLRRPSHLPEHSSLLVKDKICDNLYLDLNHIHINHLPINESPINQSTNLYLAHEILQAKCIYDQGGVHYQLLSANSWIKKYLPVAYRETIKQIKPTSTSCQLQAKSLKLILFTVNCLLFTFQYIFMRPRLTGEKVGLGYAFFHPRPLWYY